MTIEQYRKQVAHLKRQTILDAAIKKFLSIGYERTTLEMIAKDAGVSTATVYKHFPTKRALFGDIMECVWSNEKIDFVAPAPNENTEAILTRLGKEYASLLRQPNIEALFRVIIAEASQFPELGEELYRRGKEPYLKRLHTYLQNEINQTRLQIKDIPLAARQFLGMINDIIFWPRFLITGLEMSEAEVEYVIIEAVKTFIARYKVAK